MTSVFSTIATYDNFHLADEARRKLEREGIYCFLGDENMVSTAWIYSNALGGIKLNVRKEDEAKALEILSKVGDSVVVDYMTSSAPELVCPHCKSDNIRRENFSPSIAGWSMLLLSFPLPFVGAKYRCFYCGHQWKEKKIQRNSSLKIKPVFALLFLLAIAAIALYFYAYPSHVQTSVVTVVPESSYAWHPVLNRHRGNLMSVLNGFNAGELKGYTLYKGGNQIQELPFAEASLFSIMTKQQPEKVWTEVFAKCSYTADDEDSSQFIIPEPVGLFWGPMSITAFVHIALVKDTPTLPLNNEDDEPGVEDLVFSRTYFKGPLKDSGSYGLFDVTIQDQIMYDFKGYTLFYVFKNNLLLEIMVPGKMGNYNSSDKEAILQDEVLQALNDVNERSKLDLVDMLVAIETE